MKRKVGEFLQEKKITNMKGANVPFTMTGTSSHHYHYYNRYSGNDDAYVNDSFSPQSANQLIPLFFACPLLLNLFSHFEQLLIVFLFKLFVSCAKFFKFPSKFLIFLFRNVFKGHDYCFNTEYINTFATTNAKSKWIVQAAIECANEQLVPYDDEFAAVKEPVKYLPISEEEALEIVGVEESEATAELVYRGSSPYYPEWKVTVGGMYYVNQRGEVEKPQPPEVDADEALAIVSREISEKM